MEKSKFSVTHKDESMVELVRKTDHKTLAVWAIDCVERVLPYFEEKYPEDHRPRNAIEALQAWINTGVFKMANIRKASLASHAAAREVGEDNAARSAARAAGQAVATAHVPTHSIGAANYTLQAIHRATSSSDADAAVAKERDWQYQHLLELGENQVALTFSAQPDESASEVHEAQITAVQFIKPREDSTIMLDLVDKALNQVALLVKILIIFAQILAD